MRRIAHIKHLLQRNINNIGKIRFNVITEYDNGYTRISVLTNGNKGIANNLVIAQKRFKPTKKRTAKTVTAELINQIPHRNEFNASDYKPHKPFKVAIETKANDTLAYAGAYARRLNKPTNATKRKYGTTKNKASTTKRKSGTTKSKASTTKRKSRKQEEN